MPTVLRIDGIRVVIYPNDHRPAHVHLIGEGAEALFEIDRDGVVLRENYGFPAHRLPRLAAELARRRDVLLSEWNRIHGR